MISSFSLEVAGGILGLLGPNGAGKTTLFRTLATVVPPRGGSLRICGEDIASASSLRRARRQIGYLPQRFSFFPSFTVTEFVRYCAWLRDVPRDAAPMQVERAIAAVDLTDRARVKVGKLSGGMLRRCAIATAIVGEPKLVLLDEPTVGLDPAQRLEFRDLVRKLANDIGSTIVLSTHLVEDVAAVCDRVCVMADGAKLYDGDTEELAARAADDVPGDSVLERGYMTVLRDSKKVTA